MYEHATRDGRDHQDGGYQAGTPGKRTLTEQVVPHDAPVVTSEVAAPPTGGAPLPASLRARMERSFGADLSDVRTHEGSHVERLGATAYAYGADLHFAPGSFDPASAQGQELIGHELAHVLQQRAGRAAAPQAKGGIIRDAGLEREADEMGRRAARGEAVAGAAAGASAPAGRTAPAGIQGNFVAGSSYQVVPLAGVAAVRKSDKQKVILKGEFLCVGGLVGGAFTVIGYQDSQEYLVAQADASDGARWAPLDTSKGTPFYVPPVGEQELHDKVQGKGTATQYFDANRKKVKKGASGAMALNKFSLPADRGKQGGLERTGFESVEEKDLLPSTKKFMAADTKSTGGERELLFQRNQRDGMIEDVERPSLMGGSSMVQGATYCAYCLQWFEAPSMDADHVLTWKAIGEWFDAILAKMNDPQRGATFARAVELRFQEKKLDFAKHFTRDPFNAQKPWVVSQMGAYYMFNNVKNLALSCKVCNQIEKNDMEWQEHLSRHAYFAKTFMSSLAPGDDSAPVRSDDKYVAEQLHDFNMTNPENRTTIDHNRVVFVQGKDRTSRNSRALLEQRGGNKARAQALIEKEKTLAKTVSTLTDEWDSDGEEDPRLGRRNVKTGVKDALWFGRNEIPFEPKQMLFELDDAEQEIETLEDDNDHLLDELKESKQRSRALEQKLQIERRRRREAERERDDLDQVAGQLYTENQRLQQQLAEQQLQIQQQQLHMQQMWLRMQQMQQHMQQTSSFPQPSSVVQQPSPFQPTSPFPQPSSVVQQPSSFQPTSPFQPQLSPFQPQTSPFQPQTSPFQQTSPPPQTVSLQQPRPTQQPSPFGWPQGNHNSTF